MDCQGRFDSDTEEYTLTDPVIVTKTKTWSTEYGPCDGGEEMMRTWFNGPKGHKCNRYCHGEWMRPSQQPSGEIKQTEHTTSVKSKALKANVPSSTTLPPLQDVSDEDSSADLLSETSSSDEE